MPPNGAVRSRTRNVLTHTMPAADRPPDPLGPLLRRRVDDRRQPVAASSWPARPPASSSSNVCSVSTGPNTSLLDDLAVVGGRLDQRRLDVQRVADPVAAAHDRGRRAPRARSMNPSTRATWSGWIIGAIVVAGSRLSPSTWRVDGGVEAGEELVADRRLDEQPGAGEADLPGVVVLPGRLGRGGVEVGVGEHDQRALAAELGGERHDVLGRRPADVAGRLGRAGEADPLAPAGRRRAAGRPPRRCPARG